MTVDRLMIDEYGISLEQMMENAGRSLAEMARGMLGGRVEGRSIAVLCGPGNNGGGGMVAARHLHNWGARVQVIVAGDAGRLKGTPRHQFDILSKMGLANAKPELKAAHLHIDALMGYGARGDARPAMAGWIEELNGSSVPILSLDVPSGLDATSGSPGSPTVHATATLTLALAKSGLLAPSARAYVGDLWLADLGVPSELYRRLGMDAVAPFVEAPIVRLA